MIAQVIPAKRLPKQLHVFDYTVPKELQQDIRVGQLISIPIRKSTSHGLVLSLSKETTLPSHLAEKVKPIDAITHHTPLLSTQQIILLDHIAKRYGVSAGTIAKMMLPPLQKRKLKKVEVNPLPTNTKKSPTTKPTYHHYHNQREHQQSLSQSIAGKTLIIVPEAMRVEHVYNLLTKEQQATTILWHSELSQKDQFTNWFAIRNQEPTIIIGTRSSVFLPFVSLDTIIIDYEHSDHHKHFDPAPRFHSKDIAHLLATMHGATMHLMSHTPSAESYYAVHKQHYLGTILWEQNQPLPTTINMKDERRGRNFSILSDKLEQAIQETTGDIFLFMNKKGYATTLRCSSCDWIATCTHCQNSLVFRKSTKTLHCHYCKLSQPLIASCQVCTSPMTKLQGKGLDFLTEKIEKLLEHKNDSVDIIQIDSDHPFRESQKNQRIIIGTQAAFPHIRWGHTSLIGFIGIDGQLAIPEFLAQEHLWHKIAEVQYYRSTDSQFLIQTFEPNHLIFRSQSEPDRFYRTDLNARRSLGYPPYSTLVRYIYGHPDKSETQKHANALYQLLENKLTTQQKNSIITAPIDMHPNFFRRLHWTAIIVRLPTEHREKQLVWLNQFVPPRWKIDPNPSSLLSP